MTIAAEQLSAGHDDDPTGEGAVREGHFAAVGVLPPVDSHRRIFSSKLTCRGICFGTM